MSGKILIGTASWSDPGFVERWYPKKMPAGERLAWYAQHFEMVEVNSTFYSVPDMRTVRRWCTTTPDKFIFNVKLHQLFSFHSTSKKFLPPNLQRRAVADRNGKVKSTPELREQLMEGFLAATSILRDEQKLGAFLLQLSPAFSPRQFQLDDLRPTIDMLREHRLAIELRNRNWLVGEQLESTISFLQRNRMIFVNVDAPVSEHFTIVPSDLNEITNPKAAYLRLHGRNVRAYLTGKTVAARFDYDYADAEIAEVAERAKEFARQADQTHVIFNNNNLDYAPRAALRLRAILGQASPSLPPQTASLF